MRLVLIDRDGVLNEDRPGSVRSPAELVMIDGSAEAVGRLNAAGFTLALVTNQSIVGRGEIDASVLDAIHDRLRERLAEAGGRLDALFVCTDHPARPTERRKPQAGMLREALVRFGASAAETPFVGDQLSDLEAAAAAGCPRVLVRSGKGAATQADGLPDHVLPVSVHDSLAAWVDRHLAGPKP